jgi:hypothetical protein
LVEFGLSRRKSSGEIVIIQGRLDDDVTVIFQVLRFDAAWDRMPAVQEKNLHAVPSDFSLRSHMFTVGFPAGPRSDADAASNSSTGKPHIVADSRFPA